ncbi:hypothetical protein GOBAR_AA05375 [Gossypium barbadense]|uniref:Uncharacterized protein n=1 Tax=Gossypium barbadense TaxID=3634 RepID=A0A2P5YHY1_GOSBA|nr:hypothetical protein GOBAR_AA05375 [Gossypium barbadense]
MLTKFISVLETQGSLLSNIESNPRKQLNVITIQDKKGLVELEPEPRQGIVVSKGKGKVDHSERKPEIRSKSIHEPCSNNNKGPIYEERRLQIKELDEWRVEKSRAHDRPKPRHDELNVSPNQLKVGNKVLLDAADPRIATYEPNGAIPLTVLSIFPYGKVEVIHPKFGTFKAVPIPREATRPCENRAKCFPTWDLTSCHSRATWPWEILEKQHGQTTHPYLEAVVETEQLTRACKTPVPTTRAQDYEINTGVCIYTRAWKKRMK